MRSVGEGSVGKGKGRGVRASGLGRGACQCAGPQAHGALSVLSPVTTPVSPALLLF